MIHLERGSEGATIKSRLDACYRHWVLLLLPEAVECREGVIRLSAVPRTKEESGDGVSSFYLKGKFCGRRESFPIFPEILLSSKFGCALILPVRLVFVERGGIGGAEPWTYM